MREVSFYLVTAAACLMFCSDQARAAARVVIITPHIDAIRHEFANGFNDWHSAKFHEPARVEWRMLGGTSDALRFVLSEFSNKPDGIGLDIFFGGGQEPFLEFAKRKLTLAYQAPPEILDAIPQQLNGMDVYDAEHTWYGAVLSSFGILQNTRVQRAVGLPMVTRWGELTDPKLYNWIGAAIRAIAGP
jgi:hypothetical protein